jgi:hypothetical protein
MSESVYAADVVTVTVPDDSQVDQCKDTLNALLGSVEWNEFSDPAKRHRTRFSAEARRRS